MSTFRYTFWLVVPSAAAVNEKIGQRFQGLTGDRYEEDIRCTDGSRTVLKSGWRADAFDEVKPVLKSFTSHEIELYRCAGGATHGIPWRRNLLKALPRRARYSRRPPRKPKPAAA